MMVRRESRCRRHCIVTVGCEKAFIDLIFAFHMVMATTKFARLFFFQRLLFYSSLKKSRILDCGTSKTCESCFLVIFGPKYGFELL